MSVVVRQGDRLAAREVAGEMVILSADDSSLFVLNEVGTAIWNAADGRASIEAIADAICAAYDVDRATALHDVDEFVRALSDAGIVVTVDQDAAAEDGRRPGADGSASEPGVKG